MYIGQARMNQNTDYKIRKLDHLIFDQVKKIIRAACNGKRDDLPNLGEDMDLMLEEKYRLTGRETKKKELFNDEQLRILKRAQLDSIIDTNATGGDWFSDILDSELGEMEEEIERRRSAAQRAGKSRKPRLVKNTNGHRQKVRVETLSSNMEKIGLQRASAIIKETTVKKM